MVVVATDLRLFISAGSINVRKTPAAMILVSSLLCSTHVIQKREVAVTADEWDVELYILLGVCTVRTYLQYLHIASLRTYCTCTYI